MVPGSKCIEMFLAWTLGCLKLEGIFTCVQNLLTRSPEGN